MPKVYSIDGMIPVVHSNSYVHPSAVLIGDVIIGPNVYIGPLASIRGDFGRITLAEGSNVQDNCIIHGTTKLDTIIQRNAHIGHGAIIHGCTIGEDAMIGMGAVIMDRAVIGESCIIGAQAVVKRGMITPPRVLLVGTPAEVVRKLTEEDILSKRFGTLKYQVLTKRCLSALQMVEALTEVEPNRQRFNPNLVNPTKTDY